MSISRHIAISAAAVCHHYQHIIDILFIHISQPWLKTHVRQKYLCGTIYVK